MLYAATHSRIYKYEKNIRTIIDRRVQEGTFLRTIHTSLEVQTINHTLSTISLFNKNCSSR